MESEKVKEIKKALEDNANYEHHDKLGYIDGYKCKTVAYADILTLINELESENERLNKSDTSKEESSIEYYNLYRDFKRENQKLKDRIAELEKENKSKTDTIANLLKNQEFYETEKLKQFAERLKKRTILYSGINVKYEAITADIIDELLKEYIDEE